MLIDIVSITATFSLLIIFSLSTRLSLPITSRHGEYIDTAPLASYKLVLTASTTTTFNLPILLSFPIITIIYYVTIGIKVI